MVRNVIGDWDISDNLSYALGVNYFWYLPCLQMSGVFFWIFIWTFRFTTIYISWKVKYTIYPIFVKCQVLPEQSLCKIGSFIYTMYRALQFPCIIQLKKLWYHIKTSHIYTKCHFCSTQPVRLHLTFSLEIY